ncbi:hypothetical protein BKA81DRAFT_21708 [Phyllosticta paracitricarpa]
MSLARLPPRRSSQKIQTGEMERQTSLSGSVATKTQQSRILQRRSSTAAPVLNAEKVGLRSSFYTRRSSEITCSPITSRPRAKVGQNHK